MAGFERMRRPNRPQTRWARLAGFGMAGFRLRIELFGNRLCTLFIGLATSQSEAASGDLNHFCALQKSIQNGRRRRHVSDQFAPVLKRSVRRHHCAAKFVASHDDLEQKLAAIDNPIHNIVEDLVAAVTQGTQLRVDGAEGRRTVALLETIYASSKAQTALALGAAS